MRRLERMAEGTIANDTSLTCVTASSLRAGFSSAYDGERPQTTVRFPLHEHVRDLFVPSTAA